jgi:hypothetical protein
MEVNAVYMTLDDEDIIRMIRSLEWGEVTVKVKNGKPVMVSKREDVKLTE